MTIHLAPIATETHSAAVTGLPALLIILVILGIIVGFGVFIGRTKRRNS